MFTTDINRLLQTYLVTRDAKNLSEAASLIQGEQALPSLQPAIVMLDMDTAEMVRIATTRGSLKLSGGYKFEDDTDSTKIDVQEDKLIRVKCSDQEPESINIFFVTYISETMLILSPLGVQG